MQFASAKQLKRNTCRVGNATHRTRRTRYRRTDRNESSAANRCPGRLEYRSRSRYRSSHENRIVESCSSNADNLCGRGRTGKECRERILTPVDKPIVVLVERLAGITAAGEGDVGDTLALASSVVVKGALLERANHRAEELLRTQDTASANEATWQEHSITHLDLSLVHVIRKVGNDNFLAGHAGLGLDRCGSSCLALDLGVGAGYGAAIPSASRGRRSSASRRLRARARASTSTTTGAAGAASLALLGNDLWTAGNDGQVS